MSNGSTIIKSLERLGQPPGWQRFLRRFVLTFDLLILVLPVAAFFWRLKKGESGAPLADFLILFGATCAVVMVVALFLLLARKKDAMDAARRVDETQGTKELFLTLTDYLKRGRDSVFLPLMIERAEKQLPAIEKSERPRAQVPLFALKRDGLAIILAFMILLVPGLPAGALGPKVSDSKSQEEGIEEEQPGVAGEEPGASDVLGFEGRVRVRVNADKKLYFMGEEITLIVEFETIEKIPEGVALGGFALVDGEANMPLPVPADFVLPTGIGDKKTLRMKIRDRLQAIKKYRRGLLAIDSAFFTRVDDESLRGAAPANRVVLQIAENAEKLRAKTPTAVKKKKKQKQKPKPKKQKKKPEKKPQKKEKKKSPKPAPGKGPGTPPPGKIDSNPFVVEPLFSGNQTKKRKVKVFDRQKEKGAPPAGKPAPADLKTRGYDRVEEARIAKLKLDAQERRQVRKYLGAIKDQGDKAPAKK